MPARRPLVLGIVAALVLAGIAGGALLLGGSTPPPVGLATPSASAAAPVVTPGASGAASAAPTLAAGATPDWRASLEGWWAVDPAIGAFADFSGSFVGYRVREELAGVGAFTAVGRTPDVTGGVQIAGDRLDAVRFEVNLQTLVSDDSRRDNQLRRQALETDAYPTASFVMAGTIGLPAITEGRAFTVTVPGDLTLHGTTRRVELPVEGILRDGVVTLTASLEIVFADYGIAQPRSMIVLSVEDRGTLEIQLQLTRKA